jgi:hypothetical protein
MLRFCELWLVVCHPHFLLTLLGREKFANFCGQPGARLDVDQSLYGESNDYSKNIIFRVMNVVLFGSPDAQSKAFHKILVDGAIVDSRWKQYMDKLNSDWNGYTIFVSCCCFILLIRSVTMLVYCDACC